MTDAVDSLKSGREGAPTARGKVPVRTCVGCRQRSEASDLLRVVAGMGEGQTALIPDPRHREPGRGAHVHPDPECIDLAERRRAFPRALRVPGPLDLTVLRQWVESRSGGSNQQQSNDDSSEHRT